MAMTNVAVSLNDSFAEDCLSWEMNGFRFHIWSHDPETLYKNPPLNCEYGKPGYFPTRKLDAKAHVNAQMIGLARIYAREECSAGKAKAAMLARKAEEDEANRVRYAAHCKREAAEEMYKALEFSLAELSNMTTTQFSLGKDKAIRDRIRAALAKADGQLIAA
jgi:hypothetical protein